MDNYRLLLQHHRSHPLDSVPGRAVRAGILSLALDHLPLRVSTRRGVDGLPPARINFSPRWACGGGRPVLTDVAESNHRFGLARGWRASHAKPTPSVWDDVPLPSTRHHCVQLLFTAIASLGARQSQVCVTDEKESPKQRLQRTFTLARSPSPAIRTNQGELPGAHLSLFEAQTGTTARDPAKNSVPGSSRHQHGSALAVVRLTLWRNRDTATALAARK